jgi:hypothetical protein
VTSVDIQGDIDTVLMSVLSNYAKQAVRTFAILSTSVVVRNPVEVSNRFLFKQIGNIVQPALDILDITARRIRLELRNGLLLGFRNLVISNNGSFRDLFRFSPPSASLTSSTTQLTLHHNTLTFTTNSYGQNLVIQNMTAHQKQVAEGISPLPRWLDRLRIKAHTWVAPQNKSIVRERAPRPFIGGRIVPLRPLLLPESSDDATAPLHSFGSAYELGTSFNDILELQGIGSCLVSSESELLVLVCITSTSTLNKRRNNRSDHKNEEEKSTSVQFRITLGQVLSVEMINNQNCNGSLVLKITYINYCSPRGGEMIDNKLCYVNKSVEVNKVGCFMRLLLKRMQNHQSAVMVK